MASVRFYALGVRHLFREKPRLVRWLTSIAHAHGQPIRNLSFVLMSDEALLEYNKRYLGHDHFTDVITFDANDGDGIKGDVLISLTRVRENAEALSMPTQEELRRVMSHGLLHLLGHGDKTVAQSKSMRSMEDACLSSYRERNGRAIRMALRKSVHR